MSYVTLRRLLWLAIVVLPVPLLGWATHSFWAFLWIVPGALVRVSSPVGTLERRLIARFGSRSDLEVRNYAVELALEGRRGSAVPFAERLRATYPELPPEQLADLEAYAQALKDKAIEEMAECAAGRARREPIATRFRADHPELHQGTVWSLLAYGQISAGR